MKSRFALLLVVLLWAQPTPADVPSFLTFQGSVTDSLGDPLDGIYDFVFSLYALPTGGVPLWTSGTQSVSVWRGSFTYNLGSNVPFPSGLFDVSKRYLGVTVESDPELTPRAEIASAAYAMRASRADFADAMSGDTLKLKGLSYQTSITPRRLNIWQLDFSGNPVYPLVEILGRDGGPNDFGGEISLYTRRASTPDPQVVFISGDQTGDLGVQFKPGVISAYEMWNEPGLAHGQDIVSAVNLNSTTSMQDLVTVTIDLPEDGYVLLTGHCYVGVSGTTASQGGYIQIDNAAGGNLIPPYYNFAGAGGYFSDAVFHWWPIHTERIFFETQGSHTYRLEGRRWTNNGAAQIWNPTLTALYIPTSYGTVEGTLSESASVGFQSATPIQPTSGDANSAGLVKVDLRDLEVRALKARQEAHRAYNKAREADRYLMEARAAGVEDDK
jgi:hypothetical protein